MSGDRGGGGSLPGGVGVLVGVVAFVLVAASGVLSGGGIGFGSGSGEQDAARDEAPPSQSAVRPSAPTELIVRSVGIDATVRPVSLDDDLALRPPRQPELTGWWDQSAEPGATTRLRGGTVIAGHTVHDPAAGDSNSSDSNSGDSSGGGDGGGQEPGGGAMDRLPEVDKGKRVLVRTENGTVRYRVTRIERYSKAELAERSERIFDQQRKHRLVLVTCEDWNGEEYLSNVVIFAQPLPVAA